MPQTLLALAAVLIFSVFALSQHTAKADAEAFAITSEVELAAGALARDRLATVLARRFDEEAPEGGVRIDPAGLSTALAAEPGEEVEGDFDDVDDFHGRAARTVVERWMGGTLSFTDSVSVQYVDAKTLTASRVPTLAKEVTVTVRAVPQGLIGTPPIAATLSQVVTPISNPLH